MPRKDYDAMTKAELAAVLEKSLTKEQLRLLVDWHVDTDSDTGIGGGAAGSPAATNQPSG